MLNRRDFIRSAAAAGGAIAAIPLVLSSHVRAQTPQALLRMSPHDPDKLATVARQAVDAALAAGASYADVRILTGVRLVWLPSPSAISSINDADNRTLVGQPILDHGARIGVRTWVNGYMGFASNILSYDADQIAVLSRSAVERANVWQSAGQRPVELAPTQVVADGRWQTPIEIDPFEVPIGEQEALLHDAVQSTRNTRTTGWLSLNLEVEWKRLDELFASSEGSLIRQRLFIAENGGGFWTRPDAGQFQIITSPLPDLAGARGYEAFSGLVNKVAEATERAEELRRHPVRNAEPGSYDVVLGPRAVGQLLANTIGHPLELDRALLRATAAKEHATSYAMPPHERLGTFEVGNDLLNVKADRTRPGLTATAGWDADGTPTTAFDLITNGVVMDYLSDRATASALEATYTSQGRQAGSNGCASDSGGILPRIKLPNLALQPAMDTVSEDDLISNLKRGYYVNDLYTSADQTGLNVQARGMHVRQIVDGKKADIVLNGTLQFSTPRFWQGLVGLGGAESVGTYHATLDEHHIEKRRLATITAPPVQLRRVNVVNTGRRGGRGGAR